MRRDLHVCNTLTRNKQPDAEVSLRDQSRHLFFDIVKMTKMRARHWLRFCLYAQFVVVPAIAMIILGPFDIVPWWISVTSLIVLVSFGVSGAAVSLMQRYGRLTLVFTQADLNFWLLRFWYHFELQNSRGVILLEREQEAT